MHRTAAPSILLFALILGCASCTEDNPEGGVAGPEAPEAHRERNRSAPPPAGVITTQVFGNELRLWPYAGPDVAGTASDPINIAFVGAEGRASPRQIRNALMALSGDRSAFGFPPSAPFNCRWTDTPSGGVQATYNDQDGWVGSVIQLQCGDYAPLRFHVRLFTAGSGSVGNAHFEVLIPGTTDHQVLSWELAEQLVTVDMMRSGLLDPAAPVAGMIGINAAPSFRTIPSIIYNGLPPELQALVRGVPGNVSSDVPIPTNGSATAFNVAGRAESAPGTSREFTLMFDQVIPKPFCGGPGDYLYVNGPVTLRERATYTRGAYSSEFHASGRLTVVPIDPSNGQPLGEQFEAVVVENHTSTMSASHERASGHLVQSLLPVSQAGHGRLTSMITVDSRGTAFATTTVDCGGR